MLKDSEVVSSSRGVTWKTYLKRKEEYYKNREHLEKIKIIFTPLDTGFIKYRATIINHLHSIYFHVCLLQSPVKQN